MSGRIKSEVIHKTIVPTLDTSAYAAGDQVDDVIEISISPSGKNKVTLVQAKLIDKDDEGVSISAHFFSADPANTSGDNDALAIPDSGMEYWQGVVTLDTYTDYTTSQVAEVKDTLRFMETDDNGKLYMLMSTAGAPTFASASDVILKLVFLVD